ncbi:MAG: 3-hydroxyacyl-CoA dehydrogenase NAD-binding domain-containing protein [Myxococcota bacterium]|jgi:3-hydroxybutyryl-CoA dehydrogenase|nr:3-hydroxyacyl-CoA dehydrogenase NAD-binding domain-containing protein [Myxococcota bacterium]
MTPLRLLIAGSGKIALDLASAAIGRGHHVWLASQANERLEELERARGKLVRRLERSGDPGAKERMAVMSLFAPSPCELDAVIEATREDRSVKTEVFRAVGSALEAGALLASTSSSFLPRQLHAQAVGFHPFYPVALTKLVELVLPQAQGSIPDKARQLASALDLRTIEQPESEAFAVNRMLLPWQCEAMAAICAGVEPRAVDEASRGPWQGLGALSLMDSIGLRTVRAAVQNYRSSMTPQESEELRPLVDGLEAVVAAGKQGNRSGDGLLCGAALPFAPKLRQVESPLAARLNLSLVRGALLAAERGVWPAELLDSAMYAAIGANVSFREGLAALGGAATVREALRDLHKRTGLAYFSSVGCLDRWR